MNNESMPTRPDAVDGRIARHERATTNGPPGTLIPSHPLTVEIRDLPEIAQDPASPKSPSNGRCTCNQPTSPFGLPPVDGTDGSRASLKGKRQRPTRRDVLARLERIERHPDVLNQLLAGIAAATGQTVLQVVAAEAEQIYFDAVRMPSFSTLDKVAIRLRCDIARLNGIKARPGSPVALTLDEARRNLELVERHIRRADTELLAWICTRLGARGSAAWPVWAPMAANDT